MKDYTQSQFIALPVGMLKHGNWGFFLAEGKGRVGVVLIHEIFGLNEYTRSVAGELSKNGQWAAAVDLFRGKKPTTVEEGRKLREALTKTEILDALENGRQLLKENIRSDPKIGTTGFCMGGGVALLGACNLDFDFCCNYYGLIQDTDEVAGLQGPVQVILGSEDERVNSWVFQSLLPAAVKHRKRVDVHLYPSARHAFHRPDWEGHNPEAAGDAWSKTLQFMSRYE